VLTRDERTQEERTRWAWEASRHNLGRDIYFYAPTIKHYETDELKNRDEPIFVPVSVTGSRCGMRCKHCRGIILRSMYEATSPDGLYRLAERLRGEGCEGLLVSGGATPEGYVPLHAFAAAMGRIKKEFGFKMAVHTGLVDRALAEGLAEAEIDSAMIDIIGDRETVREVYGLPLGVEEYERSLRYLVEAGVKTSPHIVIGLHFGEIRGEYEALRVVSRYPVDSLVLVVISPLQNTPMATITPPAPQEILEVFLRARALMPAMPTLLGCARPGGRHKDETDRLILRAGVNGIAYPAEGIVAEAQGLGLTPYFSEYCCALVFEPLKGTQGEKTETPKRVGSPPKREEHATLS
jgi:uncharacterized radical SAM superfamily protein